MRLAAGILIALIMAGSVKAGDVLEVEVFGNPDLSRNPTVQTNGMVALTLLGEVPVAGLTIAEIKARLTERLGRDYLVNPQVDVRVKEYHSQFITMAGEIATPGRRPLRGGQMRLIDVLVEAGGLTPRASGELLLSRADGTFEDGGRTMRVVLGAQVLTPEDERRLQVPLRAGDVITASPKYYVTVEGEVVRPGRFVLDTALTVSGAVSSAGGLTRFGRQKVNVRRIDAATAGESGLRRRAVADQPCDPDRHQPGRRGADADFRRSRCRHWRPGRRNRHSRSGRRRCGAGPGRSPAGLPGGTPARSRWRAGGAGRVGPWREVTAPAGGPPDPGPTAPFLRCAARVS